jgi:hypothetical protein
MTGRRGEGGNKFVDVSGVEVQPFREILQDLGGGEVARGDSHVDRPYGQGMQRIIRRGRVATPEAGVGGGDQPGRSAEGSGRAFGSCRALSRNRAHLRHKRTGPWAPDFPRSPCIESSSQNYCP